MTIRLLRVAVSICFVLLIITLIFTFLQLKKNQSYERYISSEIGQSLNVFLTAIMVNEETLNQYMSSGKKEILPEQATTLCYNFKSIGMEYEELLQTYSSLKKTNDVEINNLTANVAQDIHFFLARRLIGNGVLGDCAPAKSTLALNEDQIEKIQDIYQISKQWSMIAKNLVPEVTSTGVANVKWEYVVNDKVWVLLLKDYSSYANKSGITGINQFFNSLSTI